MSTLLAYCTVKSHPKMLPIPYTHLPSQGPAVRHIRFSNDYQRVGCPWQLERVQSFVFSPSTCTKLSDQQEQSCRRRSQIEFVSPHFNLFSPINHPLAPFSVSPPRPSSTRRLPCNTKPDISCTAGITTRRRVDKSTKRPPPQLPKPVLGFCHKLPAYSAFSPSLLYARLPVDPPPLNFPTAFIDCAYMLTTGKPQRLKVRQPPPFVGQYRDCTRPRARQGEDRVRFWRVTSRPWSRS